MIKCEETITQKELPGYYFMREYIPPGESHIGVYTEKIFEQMHRHWEREEYDEYDTKLGILFRGDRIDVELAKNCKDLIGCV